MSAATVWLLRHRLASQAAQRLKLIKRRMPFLLDLLTLLMEAGSTFLNALIQSVSEFEGHPVAEEFGRVLNDMNLGKTRSEAFQGMRDRLNDDEITSIIGSILQGEHLGTPLAQIFRTQADVLRLKRTQRAETVAGEAGVNMLLPGILVMASTVLIILGPFLAELLELRLRHVMPIKLDCPRCKKVLSIPSKKAGSYALCPTATAGSGFPRMRRKRRTYPRRRSYRPRPARSFRRPGLPDKFRRPARYHRSCRCRPW